MEVRPGYKQTEVGPIPADWDVCALGDLCVKVGSGITPTGGQRIYRSEGRPFVRSQNVGWGNLLLDDVAFIDEVVHSTFIDTEIQSDDVFLNITGASIGRSAVADSRLVGGNVNQHVCIVRANVRKLVPRFLNMFLLSAGGQRQIDSFQAGGNRQGLNFGQVRSMRVPLPPTEDEQRAIASALSDVDALLDGLDWLVAKKRDLKQATMQQLLTGQTRLSGFRGEWQVKRLGEFTVCVAGGTPSTLVPSYWGGSIKWMSSGELHEKTVEDVAGRVTEDGLRNSAATLLPKRCVLVGLAGQGKTRGTVAINLTEMCTNQSIAAILPAPAFLPEYLYYNLDRRYDELRDLSSGGGGRGGLNLKLIASIPVPLPSIAEQTAIATVLADIDAEITALEARRDKTRALKQGMMQELLTGRTRLL